MCFRSGKYLLLEFFSQWQATINVNVIKNIWINTACCGGTTLYVCLLMTLIFKRPVYYYNLTFINIDIVNAMNTAITSNIYVNTFKTQLDIIVNSWWNNLLNWYLKCDFLNTSAEKSFCVLCPTLAFIKFLCPPM